MTWEDVLKNYDEFAFDKDGKSKNIPFKDKVKYQAKKIVRERHGLKFDDFLNAEQKREAAHLAGLMFRGMSPEQAKLQPYYPPKPEDSDFVIPEVEHYDI